MPKSSLRGAGIYALLRPIAAEVRKRCSHQLLMVGNPAGECLTHSDFVALSESCAFEAWRAVVRQLRKVGFDPEIHRTMIVDRARQFLVREMQGQGSNFGDWRMRRAPRRSPLPIWTTWQTHVVGGSDDAGPRCLAQDLQAARLPQETEIASHFRAEIEADLRRVLSSAEYAVVVAHYLDGRPQRDIAREMAAKSPRYRDAGGLKRAETRVNVLLHRARQRARTRLSGKWLIRAQEAVA